MMDYRLYGLRVRSVLSLPAKPIEVQGVPDVFITFSELSLGSEPPEAEEVLAKYFLDKQVVYTLSRLKNGEYWLEFSERVTLRISRDLRQVRVILQKNVSLSWVSHLLVGVVPAVVLTLSGEWLLHASAVAFPQGVVAMVGETATGKTTLAALLCRLGARLVTDDLLRLHKDSLVPTCEPGPGWLRLRLDVLEVISFPQDWVRQPGPDHRVLLWVPTVTHPVGLQMIVFPELDGDTPTVSLLPVKQDEAFRRIFEGVKVGALLAPSYLNGRLEFSRRLTQQVPMYRLLLPRDLSRIQEVSQEVYQLLQRALGP